MIVVNCKINQWLGTDCAINFHFILASAYCVHCCCGIEINKKHNLFSTFINVTNISRVPNMYSTVEMNETYLGTAIIKHTV